MEISEITLERVKLSYQRTGLIPANGLVALEKTGYACALATLAEELGLTHWDKVLPTQAETRQFYLGFDAHEFEEYSNSNKTIKQQLVMYRQARDIAIGLGLIQP